MAIASSYDPTSIRQSLISQFGWGSPLAKRGGPSPGTTDVCVPSELRHAVKTRFIMPTSLLVNSRKVSVVTDWYWPVAGA
ncbi:MAG: hypothetical protein H7276_02260 [Caulobacter sp.]|nr:hypothetical protein [Vitreoscilla sp.]